MFLQYYGLTEQPFGVTADPRFFYHSRNHEEALASLLYGIENDLGFTAVVAEPGLGKTTLLFHVLESFRHSAMSAFLFEAQGGSTGLLRCLLKELNVTPEDKDPVTLQEQFREVLVGASRAGRRVIVILDEAQNLEPPVLEAVRLLSNFESRRAKLLHIILAGQPPLAEVLARPDMAQLQQRLSATCWLQPLGEGDTAQYVRHRLRVAGHSGESLFTDDALRAVAMYSGGVPRKINRICFNSLSLACALEEKRVTGAVVEKAMTDNGIPLMARQRSLNRPADDPVEKDPAGRKDPPAAPQGQNGQSKQESIRHELKVPLNRSTQTAENGKASALQGAQVETAAPANRPKAMAAAIPVRGASGSELSQEAAIPASATEPVHRSLVLAEKMLGPEHPDVGDIVANLAVLYHRQGKYADAEGLHHRARQIRERTYGPNHPKVATTLNNLALLYRDQGKDDEAQELMERSLEIVEQAFGREHPKTTLRLSNLEKILEGHGNACMSHQPLPTLFERYGQTRRVENRTQPDQQKGANRTVRDLVPEFLSHLRRPWSSLTALSILILGPGARPCF
jgi:general secretion pathway protein A